jgi:hypothetical protein
MWHDIGCVTVGFSLALLFIALYGRLFGKEEVQEKVESRRNSELLSSQQQMWLSEVRNAQVAKTALSSILFMAQEHVPATNFTHAIADLAGEALKNMEGR